MRERRTAVSAEKNYGVLYHYAFNAVGTHAAGGEGPSLTAIGRKAEKPAIRKVSFSRSGITAYHGKSIRPPRRASGYFVLRMTTEKALPYFRHVIALSEEQAH